MLSPESMAGLTLFLAVMASWGILHTVAVFMRNQRDVVELNRRVKILRAEYLGRSKARRNAPGAVIEVGAADSHSHAA
jgi:hypothetical protein